MFVPIAIELIEEMTRPDGPANGVLLNYRALSKASTKLPSDGSILVSSYSSPIDVLYLATIFDPIFTASYPTTTLVEKVTLFTGLIRAFSPPRRAPPKGVQLVSLQKLQQDHPHRFIALFPEGTPTNGRGILRFTPSINAIDKRTPIFPVSLRYTAPDITTPIPRSYLTFLWYWLGTTGHCIRVRIGEKVFNSEDGESGSSDDGSDAASGTEDEGTSGGTGGADEVVMSKVARSCSDSLARLGRVKVLNLGIQEKVGFVNMWTRTYGKAW